MFELCINMLHDSLCFVKDSFKIVNDRHSSPFSVCVAMCLYASQLHCVFSYLFFFFFVSICRLKNNKNETFTRQTGLHRPR